MHGVGVFRTCYEPLYAMPSTWSVQTITNSQKTNVSPLELRSPSFRNVVEEAFDWIGFSGFCGVKGLARGGSAHLPKPIGVLWVYDDPEHLRIAVRVAGVPSTLHYRRKTMSYEMKVSYGNITAQE